MRIVGGCVARRQALGLTTRGSPDAGAEDLIWALARVLDSLRQSRAPRSKLLGSERRQIRRHRAPRKPIRPTHPAAESRIKSLTV